MALYRRRELDQSRTGWWLELAEHFATLPPDPEFQQRLDELGQIANEGKLTVEQRREYDTYVEAMDVFALLRVKVLARMK